MVGRGTVLGYCAELYVSTFMVHCDDGGVKGVWDTSNGAVFAFAVESRRGRMCVRGVCVRRGGG